MSHFIIQCEGDMEHGLDYIVKLAKHKGDDKSITISFPSEELATIFTNNLFRDFIINKVPRSCGLDLVFQIPEYGE